MRILVGVFVTLVACSSSPKTVIVPAPMPAPPTAAPAPAAPAREALGTVAARVRAQPTVAGIEAQVAATRALVERAAEDRALVIATLLAVVDRTQAEMGVSEVVGYQKLYAAVAAPAIEGLAVLHAPEAVEPLLRVLYRHPALQAFVKHALVAAGPSAKAALVRVLRGEHADLDRMLAEEKLVQHCDAKGCKPRGLRDHLAADVLAHFHDPAVTPALVEALRRRPLPLHFTEAGPSPSQHVALLAAVRASGGAVPLDLARRLVRDRQLSTVEQSVVIESLAFTATPGVERLLAELARSDKVHRAQALVALSRVTRDLRHVAAMRRVPAAVPAIARVVLAAHCRDDLPCYRAVDAMPLEELKRLLAPHMPEVATLEPLDLEQLRTVALDRTLFELRRAGPAASAHTDLVLELATANHPQLRYVAGLALTRIAPSPCPRCLTDLDGALRAATDTHVTYELTLLREFFVWSGRQP